MTRRVAFRRLSRPTRRATAVIAAVGVPLLATTATLAASSGSAASSGAAPSTVAPDGPASSGAGLPSAQAVASCTSKDLPTLGGPYGNAIAAATNGDLVGIADDTARAPQPVLWRAGKPHEIRTGLADSVPADINAHGDVVGSSPNGENTLGWVWTGSQTIRLRGAGNLTALPAAISDSGTIAGALETTEGTPSEGDGNPGTLENEQAAVWRSPTSPPQKLAPLPGDQGAHAYAIGAHGQIGGVSEGDVFRPVLWDQAGKPHPLPGLGGGYGIVRAFGPGGVAVGDVVAKDGTDHAVMWDAAGRITDLGLPAGSRTAQATGVLPGGVVVGTAHVPAPGGGVLTQAVSWPSAGHPQLLAGQGPDVVAGAAPARAAVGYRADAKGGRHPVIWRCK
jgi:YD repeat-containing protein